MKWTRRAAVLAAAALLGLSLTACSGGTGGAAVTLAREKLAAVTSLNASYATEMTYEQNGESTSSVSEMDLTVITAPALRLKADVTMERTGDQKQEMTLYVLGGEEGRCTQYLTSGGRWVKSGMDQSGLGDYNVRESLLRYLSAAVDFKEAGTDRLGGQEAVRYDGALKGEALVDVLDRSGALEGIGEMSRDQQEKIKTDLEGLEGIPVSVWVGRENGYPVRFEMDMTRVLAEMPAQISKTLGGLDLGESPVVTKALVRIACSSFNVAEDFTLPEEAEEAREIG